MATPQLTPLEDKAWQGLLYVHDRLWRESEADLEALGMSMAEYSVMALLAGSGRNGMRMSELAQRRVMSTGGFSRLVDRLQARGLVERRRAADDGRGYLVLITGSGRALLRKAWRIHHDGLRRRFFDHLDEADLADLARVWERLDPQWAKEHDAGG